MSLRHCIVPTAHFPARALIKLASQPLPALSARHFTSSLCSRQSSKRKLVTTTAYRPYELQSTTPPPPPRNFHIPDTSIAGTVPQLNDIRPPPTIDNQIENNTVEPESENGISIPEIEAQKSKPVADTQPNTSLSQTITKPKRPKLRPRKAAMSLTPAAIQHLRQLLAQPEPKIIRVGVKNRGCSGLAYHLEYVEKPGSFDETVEQDGVKVLIDSKALFSIIGSEMDWVEDKLSQRFVFRNPNIKEQCGCGESFMV